MGGGDLWNDVKESSMGFANAIRSTIIGDFLGTKGYIATCFADRIEVGFGYESDGKDTRVVIGARQK